MTQATPLPIMLALDVPSPDEARSWIDRLKGDIAVFKVGMQLFYQAGPAWFQRVQEETQAAFFLDLKLHDIPNTVEKACESLRALSPQFLTLHVSGGQTMIEAAVSAFQGTPTQLLGVTMLTSLDNQSLSDIFPLADEPNTFEWAVHMAKRAVKWGCHGIVCSAQETPELRSTLGPKPIIVNPGIRLADSPQYDDQRRVVTPKQALLNGASYLVIGRPILSAADPHAVIAHLRAECEQAQEVGTP